MSMKHAALLVLGICACVGCASPYKLQMPADREPVDETAVSPSLSSQQYKHVMVIPPTGTVRGQFDNVIALFEREFLKSGITVISGAITGRVVYDAGNPAKERRVEGAAQLSDAERALIMAKESGADAILQIGQFEWTAEQPTRCFTLDVEKGSKTYREVSPSEWRAWRGEKYHFPSRVLSFLGRLIDVRSGEVIASFKGSCAVNWSLPMDYATEIEFEDARRTRVNESFDYENEWWIPQATERTQTKVIQLAAKRLVGP